MGLYQFPVSIIAVTGVPMGGKVDPATVPAGAEILLSGADHQIRLPAGLTLQMDDAAAAKIVAQFGPYAGPVARKATPDWIVDTTRGPIDPVAVWGGAR